MKNMLIILTIGFSTTIWGRGLGVSSYPLGTQQDYVAAEFTGILSNGRGTGLQARYLKRVWPELVVGGGFGFSDGARAHQMFASADYELYPDFMDQPKISLQASLERAQEFNYSHTKIGIAPIVSKGLSFWGKEGFPFVSFPMALDLNNDSKNYDFVYQLAFGASAPMPFVGYEKLLANFEVNLNIANAYSGVFFGFSHPLN